jgi:uncharacterized protein (DUF697 family)/GTP-binding protein EngB required for normal cell division
LAFRSNPMSSDFFASVGSAAVSLEWEKLTNMIDNALKEQLSKMGRFNVIVAGRTGTGKSTLVNAVFGEEFARTAMGKPVTQCATWHERENHPLRILDTKGLETATYQETWDAVQKEIRKGRGSTDPSQHIHMGWVCIQEPGLRVEDAEKTLIEALKAEGFPTIVVLTKHGMFPEFLDEVVKLAPTADAIIPVRALPMRGFPEVHGLDELVASTVRLLPDGVRSAFVAAQAVDFKLKAAEARRIILGASTAAGGAALVPLPFSDAVTIVPIQISMIVGISVRFGIGGTARSLLPLASSMVGCMATTAAGRIVVGQLLKLIPGGGLVNATVAATLTTGLGEAYLAFLLAFHESFGRLPTANEIAGGFKSFWQKRFSKGEAA